MKKTIEADLKRLAKSILEENTERKISQLKESAKILYEKLTILDFTYSNLEEETEPAPKTVSYAEDTAPPSRPQPSRTQIQTTNKEGHYYVPDGTEFNDRDAITEPNTEKIKDIVAQMPPETEGLDKLMRALHDDWPDVNPEPDPNASIADTPSAPEPPKDQVAQAPIFEPKQYEPAPEEQNPEPPEEEQITEPEQEVRPSDEKESGDFRQIGVDYDNLPNFEPLGNRLNENKPKSVNDRLKRGISIGLNERLAYIKHLFGGNTSDYNRVLSQLNTFSDFSEAYKFIQLVVKPDYNNWEGKEQYEERFVRVVENKFQ